MKGRKKKAGSKTSRTKTEIASPTEPLHEMPAECHDSVLLDDDSVWWTKIEIVIGENPEAAESLAYIFQMLKEAIESGPEGVARACFMLSDGIRLAYENTEAHLKALCLYNLFIEGRLRFEDEPVQLIVAAIARADPE